MTSPAFREYWRQQAGLRYAGFWPRTLALLVDAIVWLPLLGISWLLRDSRAGAIAGQLIGTAIGIAYPVFMHGRFGQTVGKMAARIQVRLVDGSAITWRAAWLRSSVDIAFGLIGTVGTVYVFTQFPPAGFDLGGREWADLMEELQPTWLRFVGYAWILWGLSELLTLLFNEKRRALHDYIAGTVVVHREQKATPAGATTSQ